MMALAVAVGATQAAVLAGLLARKLPLSLRVNDPEGGKREA